MTKEILVYGAGGFGREVAWLVESCNEGHTLYNMIGFIDDAPLIQDQRLNGFPVLSFDRALSAHPGSIVVRAIGSPHISQMIMERCRMSGFIFDSIIHPRVEYSKWIEIGVGAVICAGSILTTNIQLGQYVQINLGCTIGHDVQMGDYTTLAPGVHVSGWVHIGKRVYIGTGAVILNGTQEEPLLIGDDVIIGAGACVTRSISAGLTVVGVPAEVIRHRKT